MQTRPHPNRSREPRKRARGTAFTLLELLIVLGIIGALAALAMPAFKGFGQGNALAAAERQMADDIGLARQYAIKNRSTVYMVFAVPATEGNQPFETAAQAIKAHHDKLLSQASLTAVPELRERALRGMTNVLGGLFSSYALYTEYSVGEQPGISRKRYLTEWRSLPDGIVFPTNMSFVIPPQRVPRWPSGYVVRTDDMPRKKVPFPIAPRLGDPNLAVPDFELPCIAFDATGRLTALDQDGDPVAGIPNEQYLAIGFGSVVVPRTPVANSKSPGPFALERPVDYVETPRFNYTNSIFRIDPLTGRSKLFKPETK